MSNIGDHFIVGLKEPILSGKEKEILNSLSPIGIILFSRNIDKFSSNWQIKMHELIEEARGASAREDFLVAIDHEGGRVHRFQSDVTHFPAASLWPAFSSEVGDAVGKELRALGFNINFAPVLDCFSEPQNTVIGDRAFASEFFQVASPAIEYAHAMERHGVLSCGKHFPGHGATIADSHEELPVLNKSAEQIWSEEISPFIDYISAGFQLIMTAHVNYPELDKQYPATLSKKIIDELLRRRCGYDAVVVSDDMEMQALKDFPFEDRSVLAFNAGCDILLEGHTKDHLPVSRAQQMADDLLRAIDNKKIDESTVLAAKDRIFRLTEYLNKLSNNSPCPEYSKDLVGSAVHQQLCKLIADNSSDKSRNRNTT